MTTARAVAITVVVAIPVGWLASQVLPQWVEGPGPRLRRECVSLVDTVLQEDRTVPRDDLEKELAKRGVTPPTAPKLPPSFDEFLAKSPEYEAAKKTYEAKWEELRSSDAYGASWKAVWSRKRDAAIRDCIINRAGREGVRIGD